ncbi:MAG: YibE/F family protein [Chloroflexota bacterium]
MARIRALAPVLLALVATLVVLALPDAALPLQERPQITGYRGRIIEVIPRTITEGLPSDLPTFDPTATFAPDDADLGPLPVEEPDYRVLLLEGPQADQVVGAYLGTSSTATKVEDFQVGDEVVVRFTGQPDGSVYIDVSDRYRLPVIWVLVAVFVAGVLLIGRGQGARALVALGLTIALVLKVVVPQVLAGTSPVPLAIVVASIITVASIGLTEGFRRPALAAILGTIAALLVTGVASWLVTEAARFSISGAEDLLYLWSILGGTLDIRGLLLAAFILGALGVLDDVTVTQAVTVEELGVHSGLRGRALWSSSLRVGRSHIGATVNTLFLAYVGASLPLVALFAYTGQSAGMVLNSEVVAIEVVRTLAGSLGILAAVPITTAIATFLLDRADPPRPIDPDALPPVGPRVVQVTVTEFPRDGGGPRPRSAGPR